MKLLIASDIHGSSYYAQKIKDAYMHHQCDKLLLLGDLLYHGPRNPLPKAYDPKEVIPILNNLKEHIIAVRGNCDAEVDQMVLDFPIMSDTATIHLDGFKIIASHGHIFSPEHLPELNEGDIFLFGHIHVPVFKKQHNIHIINPGSITLPKENSEHSYLTYENNIFTLWNDAHKKLKDYKL